VFLAKIRWTAVRFAPLTLLESILSSQAILVDQWMLDPESGCLLRRDRPSVSPFRVAMRTSAAVDRVTQSAVRAYGLACVEFEPDSGLWCVARYLDFAAEARWADRVKGCFRLLADSGFGARRSSGWGQAEEPGFQQGTWPNLLMPKLARISSNGDQNGTAGEPSFYWLLSLYSPAPRDAIDWSGGDYRLTTRGGRVDSAARAGAQKKAVQMIVEGSVLAAREEPIGAAIDVSLDGFVHPVYRGGFAVALELPRAGEPDIAPVEIPSDEEALEPRPCAEESPPTPLEDPSGVDESPEVFGEPESADRVEAPQTPIDDRDSSDEL
jgi:CRISPR type III-A-associated RAMP protein Csm4